MCFYFGVEQVQRHPQIPVGMVASAWGGTDVQVWMSSLPCKWHTLACKSHTLPCKSHTLPCKSHTLPCKWQVWMSPAALAKCAGATAAAAQQQQAQRDDPQTSSRNPDIGLGYISPRLARILNTRGGLVFQ